MSKLPRRILYVLRDNVLDVIGLFALIIYILIELMYDLIKSFDSEYGKDGNVKLPLNDKIIEKKERTIQVYIVVFGLFASNFPSTKIKSDLSSVFEFNLIFISFFCTALLYYIFLSRCITNNIQIFVRMLALAVGISFGHMLLEFLNLTDQFSSLVTWSIFCVFSFLIFFTLRV